MSALTLVMSELTDLDPDEFLNVRAYHTCGKNFRQVLLRGGRRSPTNSDSSGISSLTSASVSAAEEEPCARTGAAGPAETGSGTPSETASAPKQEGARTVAEGGGGDSSSQETLDKYEVNIIEEVQPKAVQIKNRIYFSGRDILNLERNLQPYKWQLASPLHEYLNPFIMKHTKFNLKKDEEYPMFTCEKCDFRQPLVY